jgi:hypothetical protein
MEGEKGVLSPVLTQKLHGVRDAKELVHVFARMLSLSGAVGHKTLINKG